MFSCALYFHLGLDLFLNVFCWLVLSITIIQFSYRNSHSPSSSPALFCWSLSSQRFLLLLTDLFCSVTYFLRVSCLSVGEGLFSGIRILSVATLLKKLTSHPQPLLNANNPLHNSSPINGLRDRNHTSISIHRDKAFDKTQNSFRIKAMERLGMEILYLNSSLQMTLVLTVQAVF